MPRNINSTLITALQQESIAPAFFVQLTFRDNTFYLWTGAGTVFWNGQTWTGVGNLLGISVVEEGSSVEARGISLTFSGFDPTLLPETVNEFGLGLPVVVYMGLYISGTLSAYPITAWSGRTDQPIIRIDTDTATISVNCENRLLDMNVPCDRRYTIQDQQMTWPGDQGFQFVQALQEINITWGQNTTSTPNI